MLAERRAKKRELLMKMSEDIKIEEDPLLEGEEKGRSPQFKKVVEKPQPPKKEAKKVK